MPKPTPRSFILASPSITRPGEIDRLNAILEDADLGRPLRLPEQSMSAVAMVPVSKDPRKVVAALRPATTEGDDHHCEVPSHYGVHTIEHNTSRNDLVPTMPFEAEGLKSGHGTVSWEVVGPRAMPPQPSRRPDRSAPVVVVLDSGVKKHSWFPQDTDPSFWFPPDPGPELAVPVPDPALRIGEFGAYWGHATFLAGLIRLHAPAVQVMSVRLMTDAGKLDDQNIIPVLNWLIKYIKEGGRADVVLMAFGRAKEPGEPNPYQLTQVITELGCHGVKFVASAGNAQSDTETIPACLDNVVSVGAGISAKDREWYSNHGPWVREWRPGTVVSLMPLTGPGDTQKDGNGFALWSGTSFSAAILAGELAQERAASAGS